MCKIKGITISHFRGVPNDINLNFTRNKVPTSLMIFGDNGSGKSSIIDAIELSTQGTIQSVPSFQSDKWIYNSISLKNEKSVSSEIILSLTDDRINKVYIHKNEEVGRVTGQVSVLSEFRNAPFVLRRQDILNFWSLPSQQKLNVFRSYVMTETPIMETPVSEKMDSVEKDRLTLKHEKREIIDRLSKYYGFDSKDMSMKSKEEVYSYIRLFENVKQLNQIKINNPRYNDINRLKEVYLEIQKLNKKHKELRKSQERTVKSNQLQNIMTEIAPIVTDTFKIISRTNDYVKSIRIYVGSISALSMNFTVQLDNGSEVDPIMLFSEANCDLLALLIYFEFIHQSVERGQAKVLVLDDVFQSIDSNIRYRIMQYVIDRFFDWQIIITTHDRLWKEQLTQLFRNHSKDIQQIEITNWSFDVGPRVVSALNNYDEKLLSSMENGSTADICASAGYMLEYMCEKLSCIFSISIHRRFGDKYTIGDLWPGIYKILKKSKAKNVFSELNDLVYLRNMAGSHYNEWSISLSRSEAEDFGKAVLDAYYHICCKKCGRWIKNIDDISEIDYSKICCEK
ncbi:AAA domain-containing protein [Eubacterium uniforme]|uniref:AAA domain-containing protein n=1 Tax=Eubacterium uniforme TaxID=39495 RepID=A0A1T4VZL0_9FIRM|nr:AAA family ATPase [Eubacterium uniforme]SKA70329.1 AAA domain-containing protein [Eubacterium uniforme]